MIQLQTLIRAKIADVDRTFGAAFVDVSLMNAAAVWVSIKGQGYNCYRSSVFSRLLMLKSIACYILDHCNASQIFDGNFFRTTGVNLVLQAAQNFFKLWKQRLLV